MCFRSSQPRQVKVVEPLCLSLYGPTIGRSNSFTNSNPAPRILSECIASFAFSESRAQSTDAVECRGAVVEPAYLLVALFFLASSSSSSQRESNHHPSGLSCDGRSHVVHICFRHERSDERTLAHQRTEDARARVRGRLAGSAAGSRAHWTDTILLTKSRSACDPSAPTSMKRRSQTSAKSGSTSSELENRCLSTRACIPPPPRFYATFVFRNASPRYGADSPCSTHERTWLCTVFIPVL
jgi:hypothetical protein